MELLTGLFAVFGVCFAMNCSAGWLAEFEGKRLVNCKYVSETLDQMLQNAIARFGSCQFVTDHGKMIKGSVIKCAGDANYAIFRSKENCEVAQKQINDGVQVSPEIYAPKGTRNVTGWLVAINSCLTKSVNADSLKKFGMQKLDDYCFCTANKVSAYFEKELEAKSKSNEKFVSQIVSECQKHLDGQLTTADLDKIQQASTKRLDSIKAPSPGRNDIEINKDLFVYNHWFFVASPENFEQMSYMRSDASTVWIGQRFGFRIQFSAKKKKVKLSVQLSVPNLAQNFKARAGKAKYSTDGKSVSVDVDVDGKTGTEAFYWSLDEKSPLGRYELKYSLDGVPVETFTFTVAKK